jgi:hypothetical protein
MLESYLKGACIRDQQGNRGRILDFSSDSIRVGWDLEGTTAIREESLSFEDPSIRFGLEILTLDRGWARLGTFIERPNSVHETVRSCIREIESLLAEETSSKKKKSSEHNPFSNKKRLGPGPRGDTMARKQRWKCSGSNYNYVCKGIAPETKGRTLKIHIDPDYKARYNREYKRWVAAKRG